MINTYRETDRQTDIQTGRHTDRQTEDLSACLDLVPRCHFGGSSTPKRNRIMSTFLSVNLHSISNMHLSQFIYFSRRLPIRHSSTFTYKNTIRVLENGGCVSDIGRQTKQTRKYILKYPRRKLFFFAPRALSEGKFSL